MPPATLRIAVVDVAITVVVVAVAKLVGGADFTPTDEGSIYTRGDALLAITDGCAAEHAATGIAIVYDRVAVVVDAVALFDR